MNGTTLHKNAIINLLKSYLTAMSPSRIPSLIIYAKVLNELTLDEIDAAMLKLMRTLKFFPAPAEILEQADNLRKYRVKNQPPSAAAAWHEVMHQAHDNFIYKKWTYSCPEVKLAVQYFGKIELCTLKTDAVNTARAQFIRIYQSILDHQKNDYNNKIVLQSAASKNK